MKLIAFSGSVRAASLNRKLIAYAAGVARDKGAEVEVIDLGDYALPIYDGDLEERGFPEGALRLKEALKSAHGMLISSPEYNSSFPPILKNAIDWASRPRPDEAPLAAFAGKACGLLAASPGALGGMRMLPELRGLLMNIQVQVVPAMFGLGKAHEAFDEHGALTDARSRSMVEKVVDETIARARALAGE